jgi:preprotein translocase subunit Sss1
MEEENKKSLSMTQLTGTFLIGAVGMLILTLYLVRRLDKE